MTPTPETLKALEEKREIQRIGDSGWFDLRYLLFLASIFLTDEER